MDQRSCCAASGGGGGMFKHTFWSVAVPLNAAARARRLSMVCFTVESAFWCLVIMLSLISCARIKMFGSPKPPRDVGR